MIETPEQREFIRNLYIQEYMTLFTYAKNSIRDENLAREAVQETFVIACSKADALISHQNPPGWLMQTLKYTLKKMTRSRAQMNALLLSVQSADLAGDCYELGEVDLDAACSALVGEENWQMYKAVTLKRMTVLEVADSLGISREAAKKRIQRTHKTLQRKTKKFK